MEVTRSLDLDGTWEDPLPHALTRTRTYLAAPSARTDVAIIAVHGRGDNGSDFSDAFVPHLCAFFSIALDTAALPQQGEVCITVRALDALDGIWFPTHKRESPSSFLLENDADPLAPYQLIMTPNWRSQARMCTVAC